MMIASRMRCNDHLDFFTPDNLIPGNDKKEFWLSKCISAQANSGGGTLFFGIKPYRGRALEIIPVDFNIIPLNWLENILRFEIFPSINKLDIYSISINDNDQEGIIVINVPDSLLRPHMASDYRYYQKTGRNEELMAEHRVRELYNKAALPQMEFLGILNTNGVSTLENGKLSTVTFYPKFLIRNSGNGIEKNLKFELWIPTVFHDPNFSSLQNHFSRLEGSYTVFTFPNRTAIFQDEICTIAEAKLVVDSDYFAEFKEGKMLLRIYHSSGMKELDFMLIETFTIENKVLEENHFSTKTLK